MVTKGAVPEEHGVEVDGTVTIGRPGRLHVGVILRADELGGDDISAILLPLIVIELKEIVIPVATRDGL